MKRFSSILLALLLLLSLWGCSEQPQPETMVSTEPTEPAVDLVLAQRRDTAEQYMRQMLSFYWSPEEDILYALDSKNPEESKMQMLLRADRIYRGIPYSYAGGTPAAFLEYAELDGDIYTVSDLHWKSLAGSSKRARVGNDGSSALALAWCQVGNSVKLMSTTNMTPDYGFLPVGNYKTTYKELKNTQGYCSANGEAVMFDAYAQLQKADGLVANGHVMMAVSTALVYNEDGTINGQESTVTILEQSKAHFLNEVHSFDEALGREVYHIGGIDLVYTFSQLYEEGFLPITCKELIDPAEPRAPKVSDSDKAPKMETCLSGFIDCNHHIDTLTITITDEAGNVVQEAAIRAERNNNMVIGVKRFADDNRDTMRGFIDISQLEYGHYRYVLVCRLVNGQTYTMRDFTFRTDD